MATSVTMRDVVWCDGVTVPGQDIRLAQVAALLSGHGGASGNALGIGSGVRDGDGDPLKVAVATALSVTVNPGYACVQGSAAANSGAYACTLDTAATLTCQTADLVNPRVDTVCVTVTDDGTSASSALVQVVTGTPAPSPAAPTLPANSLALCSITVPANATSLSAGDLADVRTFTAGPGGIKPVASSAYYPAVGTAAMYLHDLSTGRLRRSTGSGGTVAPSTVGFAPVAVGPDSTTAFDSTYVNIVSATVTVDGATSVKLTASWTYVDTTTVAGNKGLLSFFRGSTLLRSVQLHSWGTNAQLSGSSAVYIDPAPAAGTYTYSLQVSALSGAFAPHDVYLYVEAQPS